MLSALAPELNTHASVVYTGVQPDRALGAVLSDVNTALGTLVSFRSKLLELLSDGPSPSRSVDVYKLYKGTTDIRTPLDGARSAVVNGVYVEVSTLTPQIRGTSPLPSPLTVDVLVRDQMGVHVFEEMVTPLTSTRGLLRISGDTLVATSSSVLYMRVRRTQGSVAAGVAGDFESASSLVTALEVTRVLGGRVVREHISSGVLSQANGVVSGVDAGSVVSVRGIGTYLVAEGGVLREFMTVTPVSQLPEQLNAVVTREVVRVRGDVEIEGETRVVSAHETSVHVEEGDEVRVGGQRAAVVRGGFGAELSDPVEDGGGEVVYAMYTAVQNGSNFSDFAYEWPSEVRGQGDAQQIANGVSALLDWISGVRDALNQLAPRGQERARRAEAAELIERHARAGYDHAASLLSSADVRGYRALHEDEASFAGTIQRATREIAILVQR